MRHWCAALLTGAALISACVAAQAQAPTKAQQDAIRSNCRSDFMRNCSSVTPGGREALECLMQNKAKVSAGCQGALNAVSAPAAKPEPKAAAPAPEPAPAAAPPPAAATPAAPAASAPAAPPPAAKRPAPATKAATPGRPAAPPPAAPPVAAPAAVAPAAAPPPPAATQPRLGEAILIRRFCTTDFRVLCQGVPLGQGRAVQCLASNAPALSPGCREAMIRTGELRP